jgi:hypothetical protein
LDQTLLKTNTAAITAPNGADQNSSIAPESTKWPDVVIALSGVINIIVVVVWIFLRQQRWEAGKSERENEERHKQRIREAKAFWMEEIVLRGSLADIHKILSQYRSIMRQYHSGQHRTTEEKERDIRAWKHEVEKIRLSLVEPGQHVAPTEFGKIALLLQDLEDLVSTEFSLDGGVGRGQKAKDKSFAEYDLLRDKLHAMLFSVHMDIFTKD